MQYLTCPTEFKAAGDDGAISGYASIFGNVDLGGEIVEAAAFKEIKTNAEGRLPILWQHNTREPVGVASVSQDSKGLWFDGRLVLEDPLAVKARAHVRAGSVRGMSVGYDILEDGYEMLKSGVRLLKRLRLHEISIVTFGMNELARVESIKSRTDFERAARQWGFSQSKAKKLSYAGWPILSDGDDEPDAADLAAQFSELNRMLKG